MKSERLANGRKPADKKNGDKDVTEHLTDGARRGDVMWVKLRGSSWWPAQVIDHNTVSKRNKPHKRFSDAILVRLYGSYEYLYVDPMRSLSEFKNILEQHNGSHREIIQKTLEKELSQFSSRVSDMENSQSEEKVENGASRKKLKKNGKPELPNSANGSWGHCWRELRYQMADPKGAASLCEEVTQQNAKKLKLTEDVSLELTSEKSGDPGMRRLKVMQCLGLVAPPGSPF